jgi:glutaredoxin
VTLYTRYQCSACENVKAKLKELGVAYREVNIMDDYLEGMKLVDAGIRAVPVLQTDEGEFLVGIAQINPKLAKL